MSDNATTSTQPEAVEMETKQKIADTNSGDFSRDFSRDTFDISRNHQSGEDISAGGQADLSRSSVSVWMSQCVALLKRNWFLKSRDWKTTLSEIMIPVVVMFFMLLIRLAVSRSDVPDELHLEEAVTYDEYGFMGTFATVLRYANFRIAFAPDTAVVRDINSKFIDRYPFMSGLTIVFPDEDAMTDYVQSDEYTEGPGFPGVYGAAIIKEAGQNAPGQRRWIYTMRFNASADIGSFNGSLAEFPFMSCANTFIEPFTRNQQLDYLARDWQTYFFRGYNGLQMFLEQYMVNASTGVFPTQTVRMVPFPTVAHTSDPFAQVVGTFLGLLFTLAFLYPVSKIVGVIVQEKEDRVREAMKMMGLSDSALFVSWFLTYGLVFLITSILIIIITGSTVYELSDKGYIFLYFFLFGMATFSFCWMISSFFSRANIASTMASLVFLVSFFGYFGVNGSSSSAGSKSLACLSAPICFGLGATIIAELESNQVGLTADSANTTIDNYNFSAVLSMLFVDIFFYLALGLYLGKVFPSSYGIPLPWNFCCRPKYCCGSSSVAAENTENDDDDQVDLGRTREKVSPEMMKKIGLRIRNLRKEFEIDGLAQPFVAVDSINANIFEDQCFALLGHNGAGKSTTINMMSGLFPPTSGDTKVYGMSVRSDLDRIRRNLGVCPQHDILWPSLTVKEHLEIFAAIKGLRNDQIPSAVEEIITAVGLTEKRHSKSGTLSGGQKRKLSVGIALIGGSKVVFLDEPTSGMDPYSRRSTWELIRQAKRGRVIILTTHFMDEADALGDRIAIMAKGQVKCVGSSLFLKNLYGVGYSMTISTQADADHKAIKSLVHEHVSSCEPLSEAAGEVSFRLPFETSKNFPELFTTIEANQSNLGIESYGMSVTTLEEVFLRVGRDEGDMESDPATPAETEEVKEDHTNAANNKAVDIDQVGDEADASTYRHLQALLLKRLNHARRDKKVWTWQFVYPFMIILVGLIIVKITSALTFPSVDMNTSNLNSPHFVPFANTSNFDSSPMKYLTPQTYGFNNVPVGVDVTSDYNMSRYLLSTYFSFAEQSRYAAFNFRSITNNHYDFSLFHNTTATHGLPIFVNLYNNMLMQKYSNSDLSARIVQFLDPLPATSDQNSLTHSFAAVFFNIGFAFIPASFIAFIVKERISKAKHLQLISGVDTTAFWLSAYVWDFMNYMVPGVLSIFVCLIVGLDELLGEATAATLLIIIFYGLSITAFTYLVSFLFDNPVTAQTTLLLFNIFSGTILLIVSIILDQIDSVRDLNRSLKFVYRLVPSYCFGEGLANLIVRDTSVVFGGKTSPWSLDITGWGFIYMGLAAPIYFGLVLAVEYVLRTPELLSKFTKTPVVEEKKFEEDEDIQKERLRVEAGAAEMDTIVLKNLRKVFPSRLGADPKVAVHGLTFGIPKGQCFGFLGVNGAGKTTTLSMLTGDVIPTSGDAVLNGLSILNEQKSVRRLIGYCPQFDALIDTLTAREHLFLFARIKGIPEGLIAGFVTSLIDKLGLTEYADRPCGGYSGGNKRKLSVGIALIGNPPIVFLDECSTGMDPKSRRFMWNLISSTMAGRSVILTTHSMEECEALCSRIGIMVGGRLRCLGSAQHLKSRYGDGYQIDVNSGDVSIKTVHKAIKKHFPEARTLERHFSSAKYRVPRKGNKLSSLFEVMEALKEETGISEYAVSETTLEQIFIHFAKQQEEEQGAVAGLSNLDHEDNDAAEK